MPLPSISVVISTCNSEKVLPLCLESIKEQDYPKDKGARAIAGHIKEVSLRELASLKGNMITPNYFEENITEKQFSRDPTIANDNKRQIK